MGVALFCAALCAACVALMVWVDRLHRSRAGWIEDFRHVARRADRAEHELLESNEVIAALLEERQHFIAELTGWRASGRVERRAN